MRIQDDFTRGFSWNEAETIRFNLLMIPFCLHLYRGECHSEREYRLRIDRFDSRSQFLSRTHRDKNSRRKFIFPPALCWFDYYHAQPPDVKIEKTDAIISALFILHIRAREIVLYIPPDHIPGENTRDHITTTLIHFRRD